MYFAYDCKKYILMIVIKREGSFRVEYKMLLEAYQSVTSCLTQSAYHYTKLHHSSD